MEASRADWHVKLGHQVTRYVNFKTFSRRYPQRNDVSHLNVRIKLTCLQIDTQVLGVDLNVVVVLDESQAEKLPAGCDAWIVEDGWV